MSWRRVWPDDADRTVTIKVSGIQYMHWLHVARRLGWHNIGPWIVRAADSFAERGLKELEERERMRALEFPLAGEEPS
jgi:hypothetical protein